MFLNKADIELRVLRPVKYNCCTSFCRCFLIWAVHIFYVKLLSTYNFCLDKITVHYINFIYNFKDNIPTAPKSCKFIFYIYVHLYIMGWLFMAWSRRLRQSYTDSCTLVSAITLLQYCRCSAWQRISHHVTMLL